MKKIYNLFFILIIGLAVAIIVTAFNNPPGNPPTGGGAVGVGVNAPANSIYINSSGQTRMTGFQLGTSATAGYVLTTDAFGVGTWQAVSALPSGSAGQTLRHNGTTWVANSIIYNDGTNVGIGTTPGQKLTVGGNIDVGRNYLAFGGDVTIDSTTGINWHTIGSPVGNYAIYRSAGLWSAPDYQQLVLDWPTGIVLKPGTAYGKSYVDIQGNLNLSGNNITGVNKISVNTIDPVFKINGQKYVTFVPDSIGQKVEVAGTAQLVNGEWSIDLAKQTDNSDLWLFYQIVKPESIIPFISSQSPASLYAFLEGSELVVKVKDGDPQARFSYRLMADRIDSQGNDYLLPETEKNEVYIDVDLWRK